MTASRLPPDDEVAERLAGLLRDVHGLGDDAAVVTTERYEGGTIKVTHLESADGTGCPLSWSEIGAEEVILEVGHGGRWELDRKAEDAEFVIRIVKSVVAGRVEEVFGPGRSQVTVTLDDGAAETTSVGEAPMGCLPAPFWPRWGKRVRYQPYLR